MLKNTPPAAQPPDMPEEQRKAIAKAIAVRVEMLNRLAFIGGNLPDAELAGLLALAEAALLERRPLVGLTRERASVALAFLLPLDVW